MTFCSTSAIWNITYGFPTATTKFSTAVDLRLYRYQAGTPLDLPCARPLPPDPLLADLLMIIFNNLCPVVSPNFLHPGTLVPSEVGLAGRHLCRSVSDSSGALRRPPTTLFDPLKPAIVLPLQAQRNLARPRRARQNPSPARYIGCMAVDQTNRGTTSLASLACCLLPSRGLRKPTGLFELPPSTPLIGRSIHSALTRSSLFGSTGVGSPINSTPQPRRAAEYLAPVLPPSQ